MEHITSILRTLCLAALLCLTSVSASAYKVYDSSLNHVDEYGETHLYVAQRIMGDDKILVITQDATINRIVDEEGYDYN